MKHCFLVDGFDAADNHQYAKDIDVIIKTEIKVPTAPSEELYNVYKLLNTQLDK